MTPLQVQIGQLPTGFTEDQAWAVGAALVAFLLASLVALWAAASARRKAVRLAESRTRDLRAQLREQDDDLRAEVQRLEDDVRAQIEQHGESLRALARQMSEEQARRFDTMARRVESVGGELTLTRTQAVLLQAASRISRARGHVADQDGGLVQRELGEAESALYRAWALAPEALKPEIVEIRRGVKDLEQSMDERAFPAMALDSLVDRIFNLVTSHVGRDAEESTAQADHTAPRPQPVEHTTPIAMPPAREDTA